MPSGSGGHDSTISRITDIRSTTRSTRVVVGVRIMLSSWEPPIGIEPMTYALRGGLGVSGNVHGMTSALLFRLLSPAVATPIHPCC